MNDEFKDALFIVIAFLVMMILAIALNAIIPKTLDGF